MAAKTLDEKISEATSRASFLVSEIERLKTATAQSKYAYEFHLARNESDKADINLKANVDQNAQLKSFTQELAGLTGAGGILELLNMQKQIQLDAQQKIVDSALTNEQQTQLQIAQAQADAEVAKAAAAQPKDNTKTYIIIGSIVLVVIAIAGFVIYKMKK